MDLKQQSQKKMSVLRCLNNFVMRNPSICTYTKGTGSQSWLPVSLCFQKRNVFVNGRSAQIAHPRQFCDIELPVLIGWIMRSEDCGDAVLGGLQTAYLLALGLGVRHPRPHTLSYHQSFQ